MSSIFISYRRLGGNILGQLLYYRLKESGYEVFFDLESMKAGRFDLQIMNHIESADVFLVLLTKNSLDRCVNEGDFVRMEIAYALEKKKKIILVMDEDFEFPESLPKDINEVRFYHGVKVNMEFAEAFYQKVLSFIEEINGNGQPQQYDFYDELDQRFQELFPRKTPGEVKEQKTDNIEEQQLERETSGDPEEDYPEDDEVHRCFSVLDSDGMETLCFQVTDWKDEKTESRPCHFLTQLVPKTEKAKTGIRKTFYPVFSSGRVKDTRIELIFLTIKSNHEALLNAGEYKNAILRVRRNPGRIKYGKKEIPLPEESLLEQLADLSEYEKTGSGAPMDYYSPFSPSKLEYVYVDPETKEVIRPKLIRKDGNLMLKLSIIRNHSYIVLQVSEQ